MEKKIENLDEEALLAVQLMYVSSYYCTTSNNNSNIINSCIHHRECQEAYKYSESIGLFDTK